MGMNGLTLMLLLAHFSYTKWCKKPEKLLKPWHMGIHLKVLSKGYPMNTNMTGFSWFSKILCFGENLVALVLEGLIHSKYQGRHWIFMFGHLSEMLGEG